MQFRLECTVISSLIWILPFKSQHPALVELLGVGSTPQASNIRVTKFSFRRVTPGISFESRSRTQLANLGLLLLLPKQASPLDLVCLQSCRIVQSLRFRIDACVSHAALLLNTSPDSGCINESRVKGEMTRDWCNLRWRTRKG